MCKTMPPLSPQISSCFESDTDEINNNVIIPEKDQINFNEVTKIKDSDKSGSFIIKTYSKQNVRYIYNTKGTTIVWRNVFLFLALHLIYLYSYYVCLVSKCWYTWIFGKHFVPTVVIIVLFL